MNQGLLGFPLGGKTKLPRIIDYTHQYISGSGTLNVPTPSCQPGDILLWCDAARNGYISLPTDWTRILYSDRGTTEYSDIRWKIAEDGEPTIHTCTATGQNASVMISLRDVQIYHYELISSGSKPFPSVWAWKNQLVFTILLSCFHSHGIIGNDIEVLDAFNPATDAQVLVGYKRLTESADTGTFSYSGNEDSWNGYYTLSLFGMDE